MVLRVGRYSNKAKSNSIHWTAETVWLQRGEADLLPHRQTGSSEGNNVPNTNLYIRHFSSFLPPRRKKTTPKSFPVVWGSPVRCPSASSSFSSPSSSGRPHQLYISKSLRTRPAWKLTVAASKYKEGVHRKPRDSAFKVKLERGMCPNSQIQRNNFQKKNISGSCR